MDWHKDGFTISTDPAKLRLEAIFAALSGTYWAQHRSLDTVARSLEHSLCFGVYHEDAQIGLARVVTDYAVFAYLCDVYILESHRGFGLGKWLMQVVTSHPDLVTIRRMALVTRDAHGLYEHVGFTALKNPERWMERFRDDV
jgi:GNAT superfamily N-acetyltransferase